MRYISLLIGLVFSAWIGSEASEPRPIYTATLVKSSHIAVDGDLTEWSLLESPKSALKARMRDVFTFETKNEGDTDLSGDFRVFADSEYIYVAISVVDDKLVFGEEDAFATAWRDDAVFIYLDGDLRDLTNDEYDTNDAIIIVSKDAHRGVKLEGYGGLSAPIAVPYHWGVLGVKAAVKISDQGYDVEVGIPWSVVGLKIVSEATTIGFGVAVSDDDDGGVRERKIGWVNYEGGRRTASIGSVNFRFSQGVSSELRVGERLSVKTSNKFLTHVEQGDGTVHISLLDQYAGDPNTVVRFLISGDVSAALEMLRNLGSQSNDIQLKTWAASLASVLLEKEGDYIEAIAQLDEVPESNGYIDSWRVTRLSGLQAGLAASLSDLRQEARTKPTATLALSRIRNDARLRSENRLRQIKAIEILLSNRSLIETAEVASLLAEGTNAASAQIEAQPRNFETVSAVSSRLGYRLELQQDDLARAEVETYLSEIGDDPQLVTQTLLDVGSKYRKHNRFEEALRSHNRILDLGLSTRVQAAVLYEIGFTYVVMGKPDEAIKQFQRVLDVYGTDEAQWKTDILPPTYFYLGLSYLVSPDIRDRIKAQAHFEHIIQSFPNEPVAEVARRFAPIAQLQSEHFGKVLELISTD